MSEHRRNPREAKRAALFVLVLAGCVLAACGALPSAPTNDARQADPAVGATALEGLPLERGYFVAQGTACGDASNATLTTHTGHGINVAQAHCQLTDILETGADTYSATEVCQLVQGGEVARESRFTITSGTAYSQSDPNGENAYSARYCTQASLPEPWRSNDLSHLMK